MKTARELAVAGLMDALDRTPRTNWPQTIEMALTAVHGTGYAEGYRIGAREDENRAKEAATEAPKKDYEIKATLYAGMGPSMLNPPQGEDRTLDHGKPSPDEELEDYGFQFLRAIARQLGREAIMMGYKPEKTKVLVRHDGELEVNLNK